MIFEFGYWVSERYGAKTIYLLAFLINHLDNRCDITNFSVLHYRTCMWIR